MMYWAIRNMWCGSDKNGCADWSVIVLVEILKIYSANLKGRLVERGECTQGGCGQDSWQWVRGLWHNEGDSSYDVSVEWRHTTGSWSSNLAMTNNAALVLHWWLISALRLLYQRYIPALRLLYQRYIPALPLLYQRYIPALRLLYQRYIPALRLLYQRYIPALRLLYQRYIQALRLLYQWYIRALRLLYERYIPALRLLY